MSAESSGQEQNAAAEPLLGLPVETRPIPVRRDRFPGEFFLSFHRRPIELLRNAAAEHGDVVAIRGGAEPVTLVAHPDLVREILVTQDKSFKKGRALENARRFLGDGLLTSEGEFHRRQRRMMQPAFHRRQIERYAAAVAAGAAEASRRWQDGAAIDALSEMMAITMPIVAQTLFGAAGMEERTREISGALNTIIEQFRLMLLPGAQLLEKLPLPNVKRLKSAERTLNQTVGGITAERRAMLLSGGTQPDDDLDLLGMLLESQDEEAAGGEQSSMTDQQIHDEVMTLFIAGHETTSVWLSWTWYLLAQHPEAQNLLRAELSEVLQGAPPVYADLPRLPLLRRVLSESLRLYPPAWAIGRRTLTDVRLGEHVIPAGSIVIVSPAVTHVDARFWPDPLAFNPDRWLDEAASSARPKFAFFPFGAGQRVCIGEQFAWMEASLLLATLMQSWRLHLQPGAKVELQPAVTLRPKRGIPMQLEKMQS